MLSRSEKREFLKTKIGLCEFAREVGGPNTEVILQDYHEGESEIIHIINGELSGHKLGDELSSLQLKKLMREDPEEKRFVSNYTLVSEHNQKVFRASTYYIKHKGELVGLLNIYYDLTDLLHFRNFFRENLMYGVREQSDDPRGFDKRRLDEIVEDMIERIFLYWDRAIPVSSVEYVENPIRQLYEFGVFNHKGAVSRVSELLNMSSQSIYRYIKTIEEMPDEEIVYEPLDD